MKREPLPAGIPAAMGSSARGEPDLRGVFATQGSGTPALPSLPQPPSLPSQGAVGWGAVGGIFFLGGSGELGSLIVLFVSQSHAVMSAVTSCSALPIGLRCLPAGPASRPPNFPRTPRRSHRPGRGLPPGCQAQPGQPSGVAKPAASPEERRVAPRPAQEDPPSPWAGWGPGFGGLAGGLCAPLGSSSLKAKPVTGFGLRWEMPRLCELKEIGGTAAFRPASCRVAPCLAAAGVGCFGCSEAPVSPLWHPDELNVHPGTCPEHLVRSLGAR